MEIQKQGIPIFLEDDQPVAGIFFIEGKRILCKIEKMSEDEIISLYERKDVKLST